jgi:hypothetical protein
MTGTTDTTGTAGDAPGVVTRYLRAADDGDFEALAACFTPEGTVVDEGVTYQGHDAIVGWREQTAAKWEYTSEVTHTEPAGDGGFRVSVHVEGNFPGGQADLKYSFVLDGDRIAALSIVE